MNTIDQITDLLCEKLAQKLQLSIHQVKATILLLDSGATVPFIARYRKEMTGSLNELHIVQIREGIQQLRELEKRRASILATIKEQGKLSADLDYRIQQAGTLTELEDLYLPFKPKRRTRATMARERGLEPLAKQIMSQRIHSLSQTAARYVDENKEVPNIETALAGARDIIAEWVNENQRARWKMRQLFERKAVITSKLVKDKEEEGHKFKDYFDWQELIRKIPSHRFLAIQRGAEEGILRTSIQPDKEEALPLLERIFVKQQYNDDVTEQIKLAITDAYKRLLQPSMETEMRQQAKANADTEAIKVFVTNLRELLLAAPLGKARVMAIDPGFRTGCKVVCLDEQGTLLQHTVVYPFDRSPMKRYEAIAALEELCEQYQITTIGIGNGTAGRETYQFVKKLGLTDDIQIVMVDESGASIYSASEVARDELGNYDVTVRGTVSIGRRLMDPLAELVKIDPKSIGVGQYQHDVNQAALKQSLDDVVVSCVNAVGVDINTASKQLLMYLSGFGPKLAQKVMDYRQQNGAFQTKKDLKKVSGIGPKAFEQSAGFIRIRNARNLLDNTAVHPESYAVVEKMAKDASCSIADLVHNKSLRDSVQLEDYQTEQIGLPTLRDIIEELSKPGRDPRQQFEAVEFADNITSIEDLREGMVLTGIVSNVTNFGAFVDVGIKEAGLVHVSELADKFVRDPKKILKVQQKVRVMVLKVDVRRKRIALSIKQAVGK